VGYWRIENGWALEDKERVEHWRIKERVEHWRIKESVGHWRIKGGWGIGG
jgi:hypothetical protein